MNSDSFAKYGSDLLELPEQEIDRLLFRHAGTLADFVRSAWHIIEPTTSLEWGPHLDAICLHLEAVTDNRIQNLIITIPPGSTKSITVSVMWPAWVWVRQPSLRWLFASNDRELVIRDAVACRRLIESEWYRDRFSECFQLTSDQNVKSWYENDRRGFRTSVTTGSSVVGKKGDVLVVDDPNDARKIASESYRKSINDWWDQAFFNRVNDHRTGRRVIIGQRTHMDDLIGHVLRNGGCEELRLPEEFVPETKCKTSVWQDWRSEPKELLRPGRFGPKQVAEARQRLGSSGYSAQHQQNPIPDEGELFKTAWFRFCRRAHSSGFEVNGKFYQYGDCWWFATVDPAGGESETADYTVIGVFAVTPRRDLIVVHIDRSRTAVEHVVPHIKMTLEGFPVAYVTVEDSFLQRKLFVDPARRTAGMPPVRAVNPGGKDKYARALPLVVAMEASQVWFLERGESDKVQPMRWFPEVRDELLQFTGRGDEHDDVVDVLSYAIAEWIKSDIGIGEDDGPFALGEMPKRF